MKKTKLWSAGLLMVLMGCTPVKQPQQQAQGAQTNAQNSTIVAQAPPPTQTQWRLQNGGAPGNAPSLSDPAAQAQKLHQERLKRSVNPTPSLTTGAPPAHHTPYNSNRPLQNVVHPAGGLPPVPGSVPPAGQRQPLGHPGQSPIQRTAGWTMPDQVIRSDSQPTSPTQLQPDNHPTRIRIPSDPTPEITPNRAVNETNRAMLPLGTGQSVIPSARERSATTGNPANWSAKPTERAPAVRMVNSSRILLNYKVKDVGPSGLSTVDLWYTANGKDWKKDEKPIRKGPPYVFESEGEGTYGFTLIARSGLGRGKQPPKQGDAPQVWVTVDTTKPNVMLNDVKQGLGSRAREITIEWTATDKHLAARPMTISYAQKPQGPWKTIATKLPNTGSHQWNIPKDLPPRFWLRIESVDQVGNIGVTQTQNAITIDMAEPSVSIIEVQGAAIPPKD